jgi:hypothetical protein
MKQLLVCFLQIFSLFVYGQKKYSAEIENVLVKSGKNRSQLQYALEYFDKSGDSLKIRAIQFLIGNMDIHYSMDYYWSDSSNKRINFNELDYADYKTALEHIEKLKQTTKWLHPVSVKYYDIDTIQASFLIENVESSLEMWKSSLNRGVSFDQFCEYILPYRADVEPLQNWRAKYRDKFLWLQRDVNVDSVEQVLKRLGDDIKKWFANTYNISRRKEPLPRLGALQLLTRKMGPCEDISNMVVFALRSQGIAVSNEMVTYWATSSGRHYFNAVINPKAHFFRFDAAVTPVRFTGLGREPAKVIRTTFSKQLNTLASKESLDNIPEGFLRTVNYIDVTHEYWKTADIHYKVPEVDRNLKTVFVCAYNTGDWHPTWWGNNNNGIVEFKNMCTGAVYLPTVYNKGKLEVAGYPIALDSNKKQIQLQPDTINRRTITLTEQERYLVFRPGKSYSLFYWDNTWKFMGAKKDDGKKRLVFNNVPANALLLLIPEYSQGKERPFIVTEAGQRIWW